VNEIFQNAPCTGFKKAQCNLYQNTVNYRALTGFWKNAEYTDFIWQMNIHTANCFVQLGSLTQLKKGRWEWTCSGIWSGNR